MHTAIIQIGNSDDKLSQAQWAHYFKRVDEAVRRRAHQVHFTGTSFGFEAWQNAAWILEIGEHELDRLKDELREFCKMFNQDSVALTIGETTFVNEETE